MKEQNHYVTKGKLEESEMDEKEIREANEYKQETQGSIYEEVFIKGVKYQFCEQLYFDNTVRIWLPEHFIELPDEIKKLKYPGEGRPQVIRTIPTGGVDFGINVLPLEGSDQMTEEFGNQMYQLTRNMRPAEIYYDKKLELNEKTGRKIAWFDYISHGIDAKLYNLIGTTYVAGKTVNYVFNCIAQDMEVWKAIALEVLFSLSDAGGEK